MPFLDHDIYEQSLDHDNEAKAALQGKKHTTCHKSTLSAKKAGTSLLGLCVYQTGVCHGKGQDQE